MTTISPADLPKKVDIFEVGPRDGLQTVPAIIPTGEKIALVEALADAGLRRIQIASFVHPKWMPQMADAEEVCQKVKPRNGVVFSGLALNLRGVERALAAGVGHIDISVSASEEHSRLNMNRTIAEAMAEFERMVIQARAAGVRLRGGIQCAFGFRRAGDVPQETAVAIAHRFLNLGIDELAFADTAGLANPVQIAKLIAAVRPIVKDHPLSLHLHDTRGMGLANVLAGLASGISRFDTAFGGLGGCPFVAGAAGNIPTEDTIHMLHQMGIQTGVNLVKVAQISRQFEQRLGQGALAGKLYNLTEFR